MRRLFPQGSPCFDIFLLLLLDFLAFLLSLLRLELTLASRFQSGSEGNGDHRILVNDISNAATATVMKKASSRRILNPKRPHLLGRLSEVSNTTATRTLNHPSY